MTTSNEVLAAAPAPQSTEIRDYFTLKARGKWVVLRMIPREERKTAGGIVISTAQTKTQHGLVVDVSSAPEVVDLHVGDVVVFTNFVNSLDDVEELTGERNLFLVREEEIYARAEKIADPEVLAKIRSEAEERYGAIARQYEEEVKNQSA